MRAAALLPILLLTLLPAAVRAEVLIEGDGNRPEIDVGGKFFGRADASSTKSYARELALSSARLALDAKWKGFLRAEVDADLTAIPLIADAYVDMKGPAGLSLRIGRFNSPFSARQLSSLWKLELVDRGYLNDEITSAGYGGRRFGAAVKLEQKKWARLTARAAIMKGLAEGQEDFTGRITLAPWKPLTFGVNAYAMNRGRTGLATGVDAALAWKKLRLSLEALSADLPSGASAATSPDGALIYGRRGKGLCALASRHFKLSETWQLQPVVGAEMLKVDDALTTFTESVGVGLMRKGAFKIQLQDTRRHTAERTVENLVTFQLGVHL